MKADERDSRLTGLFLPPEEGFALESWVGTTFDAHWDFIEDTLLPVALGVRAPSARLDAFRWELEPRLRRSQITILQAAAAPSFGKSVRRLAHIDAVPIGGRKLHSKMTLLLWSRGGATPEKRVSLIVGSANLTAPGFQTNYEVASRLVYGGRRAPPRRILTRAIDLLGEYAGTTPPKQLTAQLLGFRAFASSLPAGDEDPEQPVALVDADEALDELSAQWKRLGEAAPLAIHLCSPFWPEGKTAREALDRFLARFPGAQKVVLITGLGSSGGKLFPQVPESLLTGDKPPLLLRAAQPAFGLDDAEEADPTEEVTTEEEEAPSIARTLHAKIILLEGRAGGVLYVGSSNFTRRGLGLGGPTNLEAGLVYRLNKKTLPLAHALLAFAGPETQVDPAAPPTTVPPEPITEQPGAAFLEAAIAADGKVALLFAKTPPVPDDLRILMPMQKGRNLLLWRSTAPAGTKTEIFLAECPQVDDSGAPLPPVPVPALVSSWLTLRFSGAELFYPVRFDGKDDLPVAGGRAWSENDLIAYFLTGRAGGGSDGGEGGDGWDGPTPEPAPGNASTVDTSLILSYQIRSFLEALRGMEAGLREHLHSAPAVHAYLFGPLTLTALAEAVVAAVDAETLPRKTPMAAAFQLVELLALLRRARRDAPKDSREAIGKAQRRIEDILSGLERAHPRLADDMFTDFKKRMTA